MSVSCSAIGYMAWYFLQESFGYLQVAPICLVPRRFALGQNDLKKEIADPRTSVNPKLLIFVYVPYLYVALGDIICFIWIWKRFSSKDSQSNASSLARARALRTIKQYLAWYLVYTLLLVAFYSSTNNVQTCWPNTPIYDFIKGARVPADDNINNLNDTETRIVRFPPSCVSWRGYQCKDENPNGPNADYYAVQNIFFALFCLRGVPELLVFLHLNIHRIIDVIRDREHTITSMRSKSSMSQPLNEEHGVQSLQFADKNTRNDIMAFTQVRAPLPHECAPDLPCSRRNTT